MDAALPVAVVMVLGIVAILVLLFAVVLRVAGFLVARQRPLEPGQGLKVLDARLQRGEISYAEYEIAKRALGR